MSQSQGYRFGQHANAARSFRDPSKLLKQGANAEIVKASWKHTSTVFRPFPMIVDGVPQPYRFDAEESNFTDWIRSYRAVMGVGNPGIDFILCDPSDPSVDRSQNPYELIYSYVGVLKKSNSLPNHIFQLTQGGNNRGAALPNTSAVTLMQGALMVHNNEPKIPARGSADNDPTCILALKSQAGDDLISLLNLRREPNAPPVDPNRAAADPFSTTFVYGDVTHLQCGGFIHTIQKGAPQQGGTGAFGGQRGGQRQQVEIGYNVSIFDRLNNGASANMGSMLPLIVSKWTPWNEILHIPTIEEQIQYLSAVLPPDLIVSALADRYREIIPQAVMQRGGAGVPAGAAYGGPGGPGYHPNAAGAYGAPAQGGGYGAPAQGGGYGAPAAGGYGGGYERPVDPGPAQGGGYGAPAQGGDYGWNNQPNNTGFDPNQGGGGFGAPANPPQGGGYGAPANPPQGGGYGAPANPPQGGGYGAPAQGGGFTGAAPTNGGGAAGGYGGPAAGGTYGGAGGGGFGAPPPQAGYGGPQQGNTGMMTPAANMPAANNPPPGTVNAQSAIEQARRQAAAGAQPPVMPAQQAGQPPVGQ